MTDGLFDKNAESLLQTGRLSVRREFHNSGGFDLRDLQARYNSGNDGGRMMTTFHLSVSDPSLTRLQSLAVIANRHASMGIALDDAAKARTRKSIAHYWKAGRVALRIMRLLRPMGVSWHHFHAEHLNGEGRSFSTYDGWISIARHLTIEEACVFASLNEAKREAVKRINQGKPSDRARQYEHRNVPASVDLATAGEDLDRQVASFAELVNEADEIAVARAALLRQIETLVKRHNDLGEFGRIILDYLF